MANDGPCTLYTEHWSLPRPSWRNPAQHSFVSPARYHHDACTANKVWLIGAYSMACIPSHPLTGPVSDPTGFSFPPHDPVVQSIISPRSDSPQPVCIDSIAVKRAQMDLLADLQPGLQRNRNESRFPFVHASFFNEIKPLFWLYTLSRRFSPTSSSLMTPRSL